MDKTSAHEQKDLLAMEELQLFPDLQSLPDPSSSSKRQEDDDSDKTGLVESSKIPAWTHLPDHKTVVVHHESPTATHANHANHTNPVQQQTEKASNNASTLSRTSRGHSDAVDLLNEGIMRLLNKELSFLNFADGDTFVFITPKSGMESHPGYQLPLRMHSHSFLRTQSPFFEKLFSPTYQYRVTRRRKCFPLPQGVKYAIDLTPPDEGEIAVELTSKLSCCKGVREWFRAEKEWQVSKDLVCGLDDDEVRPPAPLSTLTFNDGGESSMKSSDVTGMGKDKHESKDKEWPAISSDSNESKPSPKQTNVIARQVPLDYTAARHHAGILRLLHAVEGLDPALNSAPKVWTLAVLGQYYECASVVVDWILRWIYAAPNTLFLELLPRPSMNIAVMLKNYILSRDAFSNLVGEEALVTELSAQGQVELVRQFTTQGTSQEEVDEEMETRIQYAGKALHERITGIFSAFADPCLPWLNELPEYQEIVHVLSGMSKDSKRYLSLQTHIEQLRENLGRYVCAHLYSHMHSKSYDTPLASSGKRKVAHVAVPFDVPPGKARLFTRMFWAYLGQDYLVDKSIISWNEAWFEKEVVPTDEQPWWKYQPHSVSWWSLVLIAREINQEMELERCEHPQTGSDLAWSFKIYDLLAQIDQYIRRVCNSVLKVSTSMLPMETQVLLCLEEDEFKYLPLWAGGDDDGTGGVFDPCIPNAEAGPSGPGPRLHTSPNSNTESDGSLIDAGEGSSSINTSLAVENGYRNHVDRRRVLTPLSSTAGSEVTKEDSLWVEVRAVKESQTTGTGKYKAKDTNNDSDDEFDGGDDESFDFADDYE